MKGLILKDLYILKGFGRSYGTAFAFLVIWAFMIKSFSFLTIYCAMVGGTMVMSTMSYDEAASFNRFALAGPVNMRTLIKEKYILLLMSLGGGAGLGILLNLLVFLSPAGTNKFANFKIEEIVGVMFVFIIASSITFPVMFKVGTEKARYIYTLSMLFIGGAVIGSVTLSKKAGLSFDAVEKIPIAVILTFLIGIGALAMFLSYLVSLKMVENKGW